MGLFNVIVSKRLTEDCLFVISDFTRLSTLILDESGPGGTDIQQANTKLKESVENLLSASIETLVSSCSQRGDMSMMEQALQSAVRDMDCRLAAFNATISDRLEYLRTVCNQLNDTVASSQVDAPSHVQASPAQPSQHQLDRSMNIVVFGVAEDRSHLVWRQNVDQALKFINGNDVESTDMFRLGRFVANKTRPIVVKLRTAWDRRILLANCIKLKGYGDGKIFISPDESLEERRKRMLKCFKVRAERGGKNVSVENGILSVDGVPTFSLQDGKIASN